MIVPGPSPSRRSRASGFAGPRPGGDIAIASAPYGGAPRDPDAPEISVVIPVFNEADNVGVLYDRLTRTMEGTGRTYEIILVDDGSRDGSEKLLHELRERDGRVRVIRLLRNFGQHPAVTAGFERVRGDYVVTLDADCQNPPEEIPKLLAALDADPTVEVAAGRRVNRKDSVNRTLPSKVVNWMIGWLTGVPLRDYGCMLRAYRRNVIEALAQCKERSLYITALISWLGVKIVEVDVEHEPRHSGTTKYSFIKLLTMNFDLLTNYTTLPIQMVSIIGMLLAGIGIAVALVLAVLAILGFGAGGTTWLAVLILSIGGAQLAGVGLIGEYIGRIYRETQARPYFLVRYDTGPGSGPGSAAANEEGEVPAEARNDPEPSPPIPDGEADDTETRTETAAAADDTTS